MGPTRAAWWIVLSLVMFTWTVEGQQPPEWTQSIDASRYLLTEAEMPKKKAVPSGIRIAEPAWWTFVEKDGRNPTGRVSWGVKIEQKFTNPANPQEDAQVSILVYESALDAGLQWRLSHRQTGEETMALVEDFYQNGPGPTRSKGGHHYLAGNLWISVGGRWKKFADAYAAALLNKHDRARKERSVAVTAYDGSDHRHMPLSFWVEVTQDGEPLAGESVRLELVGEVRCLADRWAWWDSSAGQWREVGDFSLAFNAIDGAAAPRTDAEGGVIVRFFLDFWRIRNMNLPLPQRVGLKASVDSGNPTESERATGGATMVVRHGAFVRALYYSAPGSPLIPLAVLQAAQSRTLDPGGSWQERWTRPGPQEGVRREGVHDRVTIGHGNGTRLPEEVVFEWPDFYVGVPSPEAQLWVDARPDEEPRSRSYLPAGSGIGVHMLWLDGSEGIFMVHAPGVLDAMISGVPNRSMTTGNQSLAHVVYFVVGQGVDVLVKTAVVGAATALGGPVAGGYAFVIVQTAMTTKDIVGAHSGYLLENGHLVMLRSEVAVTCAEQQDPVLHVFEGSPGVVGAAGTEIVLTGGQSIDLLPGGATSEVRHGGPSGRAVAMRKALETMGPPAPDAVQAMAQLRDGGAPTTDVEIADGGSDTDGGRIPLLLVVGLVLIFILFVAVVALAAWWLRRSSRSRSPPGAAASSRDAVPPTLPQTSAPPPPAAAQPVAAPPPLPAPPPEPNPEPSALIGPSGARYSFAGRCTTIGSAGNNDIVLPERSVSRRHARVFREPNGQLWIEDLASTNGVRIDGRRVDKAWLQDGTELALGSWRGRVHVRIGAPSAS